MTSREARMRRLMDVIHTAYLLTSHPFATARSAEVTGDWLKRELHKILDEEYNEGADAGSNITLDYLEEKGYLNAN